MRARYRNLAISGIPRGKTVVAVLGASALLFGIARNHPFEQGNKRTGFTAALVFLQLNGYEVTLEDDESLADIIVDVITRKLSEDDFHVLLSGRRSAIQEPLGGLYPC